LSEFETIIGLEVHVELLTDTKLFCGCSTAFGAEPNTQVCPMCLGLPGGTQPLLNKKAVEFTIKAAQALNCEIAPKVAFDRKNYFYADLPQGFQISQFFHPLGRNGYIEFRVDGKIKRVGIHQVHLEEDTGKLFHLGDDIMSSPFSQVDFNRAGVPLMEIVSEPDIRTAEEARLYLQKLRSIIRYLDISDCKMEEGSMRCDANISIRPKGSSQFGEKTELKNMNSFRSVYRGIAYEEERQRHAVLVGESILPETRHWDEAGGVTHAMRSKHVSAGYRCFPDPNIPPYSLAREWILEIKSTIPELPDARYQRFIAEDDLADSAAEILSGSKELADFYDAVLAFHNDPKMVSNWITSELLGHLNAAGQDITESKIKPEALGKLLQSMEKGEISGKIGKAVFEEMFNTGKDPATIIKEKGFTQISDEDTLHELISSVLEANPKSIEDYHSGKKRAMGFLVGQIMKETKGQANPQLVSELLLERLKELK
jgi:aspartyl-tRNA(Asn)/glutamyl-tRNA(Gln) amidotransferase subunit B